MYNDKKKWFDSVQRLAVIGVSDWIANEAKNSLLSTTKIITRIYNWIDLDVFKLFDTACLRKELNLENKFIILGVASVWSNPKGFDKFMELSKIIQDDMIIILVGHINKEISLPNNVIHIKETHNINELVEYYSIADVFLNLSLEESFGKVTIEALACGTPVIVVDSTANPELVGEGCGYILEETSVDYILKKIKIVMDKGKDKYSLKCIEYARENFNIKERMPERDSKNSQYV